MTFDHLGSSTSDRAVVSIRRSVDFLDFLSSIDQVWSISVPL